MTQEQEQKSIPQPMEALTIVLASLFFILFFSLIYKLIFPGVDFEKLTPQESRIIYILGGLTYLILPIYYSKQRGYDLKVLLRFNRIPIETVIMSLLLGLALMVIGDEIDRLVALIKPLPEWMDEIMLPLKAQSGWEWFLIITGAVFITAIGEEVLFRGFFQVALEKKGDVTRAVLISTATWTIIHFNIYWAAQIFITGIFFGFIAWRTNSVIPAILAHGINNLIAVLLINSGDDFLKGWYEWQGHVSPIAILIALGILIWSIRQLNLIHGRHNQVWG